MAHALRSAETQPDRIGTVIEDCVRPTFEELDPLLTPDPASIDRALDTLLSIDPKTDKPQEFVDLPSYQPDSARLETVRRLYEQAQGLQQNPTACAQLRQRVRCAVQQSLNQFANSFALRSGRFIAKAPSQPPRDLAEALAATLSPPADVPLEDTRYQLSSVGDRA